MENAIRLTVIERNGDGINTFSEIAENVASVQITRSFIWHPHIIEDISSFDADIFFVDSYLPCSMSDFIKGLKAKISPSKILIACEFVQPDLVVSCLRAGANGYLEKSVSPQKFEQTIRECHKRMCFLPLSIAGLLYKQFIAHEGDAIRRTIFQLLSRGFLLKEIIQMTGLSENEIKSHVFLSLHR
jgi:DNA-binding NarL/FixJ family response regulator